MAELRQRLRLDLADALAGDAELLADLFERAGLAVGEAGVATELHVYPGAPHGVQMFATSDAARRWNRHENEWLARQLHPDCSEISL